MPRQTSMYDPCHFDRDFDDTSEMEGFQEPLFPVKRDRVPEGTCSEASFQSQFLEGGRQTPPGTAKRSLMLDIPTPEPSTKRKTAAEIRFSRPRKRVWSKTSVGLSIPGRYFFLPSPRRWMRHGPFKRVGRYSFCALGVRGTISTILAYEPLRAMVSYTLFSGWHVDSIFASNGCDCNGRKYTSHLSFGLNESEKNPRWRLISRNKALVQLVRRKISGMNSRSRQTYVHFWSQDGGSIQDGRGPLEGSG